MTIDEVIDGLKRIFFDCELNLNCTDSFDIACAAICKLIELKSYKVCYNIAYKNAYNKAIDDFVCYAKHEEGIERINSLDDYDRIAAMLKGGGLSERKTTIQEVV